LIPADSRFEHCYGYRSWYGCRTGPDLRKSADRLAGRASIIEPFEVTGDVRCIRRLDLAQDPQGPFQHRPGNGSISLLDRAAAEPGQRMGLVPSAALSLCELERLAVASGGRLEPALDTVRNT
jgi:hypothetical protein